MDGCSASAPPRRALDESSEDQGASLELEHGIAMPTAAPDHNCGLPEVNTGHAPAHGCTSGETRGDNTRALPGDLEASVSAVVAQFPWPPSHSPLLAGPGGSWGSGRLGFGFGGGSGSGGGRAWGQGMVPGAAAGRQKPQRRQRKQGREQPEQQQQQPQQQQQQQQQWRRKQKQEEAHRRRPFSLSPTSHSGIDSAGEVTGSGGSCGSVDSLSDGAGRPVSWDLRGPWRALRKAVVSPVFGEASAIRHCNHPGEGGADGGEELAPCSAV